MQARTTAPAIGSLFGWLVAVLGVGLLVILLLSFVVEGKPRTRSAVPAGSGTRVAYFEFGRTEDVLWLADPADPAKRRRVTTIAHASGFGVIPSLSPDRRRFVYSSLDPALATPSHDSPAGLWLASLNADQPRQLATGVDLLVAPVWSPDGRNVVFRRTTPDGYILYVLPADGGDERVLAVDKAALFPVAFAPAGDRLYYVSVDSNDGSQLHAVELATGVEQKLGQLAPGLTRDWALSPDGARLAYLRVSLSASEAASTAYVYDIASATVAPRGDAGGSEFGPVWSGTGSLFVGFLDEGASIAQLLQFDGGESKSIAGPPRGFEVPLAVVPGSGLLVRSFSQRSVTAPGRETLTLLQSDGKRTPIASGEVSFLGWANQ